jgi:hypothetical protein
MKDMTLIYLPEARDWLEMLVSLDPLGLIVSDRDESVRRRQTSQQGNRISKEAQGENDGGEMATSKEARGENDGQRYEDDQHKKREWQ